MAGSDELDGKEPIEPSSLRPAPRLPGILKNASSGGSQKAQSNVSIHQTQPERDALCSGPSRRMKAPDEEQRGRRKRYHHHPYADSRRKMSHKRVEEYLADADDEDENANDGRNWVQVPQKPYHRYQHHLGYHHRSDNNVANPDTTANAVSNIGQVCSPRMQLCGNLASLQLGPSSPVETHNALHSYAPAGGLNTYGVPRHMNYRTSGCQTTNECAGGFGGQARRPSSHRRRLCHPVPQQDRTQRSEASRLADLYNKRDQLEDEISLLRSRPRNAEEESCLTILTTQLRVVSSLLTHRLPSRA
ncbi:hypothetical protein CKAH01_04091 [Colletotrichum kahawae]|uniref:Uncharacterized protein n=1 Tax=Colletotrichum kahawae TaxID=34407 RepID=A0AAE0D8R8_COLKA|nr:hypothetical protein CKAH01_04091 [Colletotrichum kahawae]